MVRKPLGCYRTWELTHTRLIQRPEDKAWLGHSVLWDVGQVTKPIWAILLHVK